MNFNLVATTPMGIEAIVAKEVQELGYETKVENGRVFYSGDKRAIVRSNLWLRCADRVKIVVAQFPAYTFEELFEKTKEIEWDKEYHTHFFQGNVFKTEHEAEVEGTKRALITTVKLFRDECNSKVKDNKVYFTGTNLDTTIKTSIDVSEVIREGEVAFSSSIIDEYLKEIKDEFVVLRVENGNILFIETEDSTTEYDVFSTEDYPNTFEYINLNENNFKFEMPSQELVEIFEKVCK